MALAACNKKAENSLVGTWRQTEMLVDPGDGSGVFMEVSSHKTISFYNDGTLISNGSLCDMSVTTDMPTNGNYSATENYFISSVCGSPGQKYHFEKNDTSLTITYPCIEPCLTKYKKVN